MTRARRPLAGRGRCSLPGAPLLCRSTALRFFHDREIGMETASAPVVPCGAPWCGQGKTLFTPTSYPTGSPHWGSRARFIFSPAWLPFVIESPAVAKRRRCEVPSSRLHASRARGPCWLAAFSAARRQSGLGTARRVRPDGI